MPPRRRPGPPGAVKFTPPITGRSSSNRAHRPQCLTTLADVTTARPELSPDTIVHQSFLSRCHQKSLAYS
jgi:hypothetical protein